jgi:hypothetical protein
MGWLLGAGAAGLLALACGQSDDFGASATTAPDGTGGSGASGNFEDSGPTGVDGPIDASTMPKEASADMFVDGSRFQAVPITYLVHAAPELFDFRVCFRSGEKFVNKLPFPSDPEHFLPASNYPGVPRGGVVEFGDSLLGTGEQVTLYLVRADNEFVQDMQPALNPKHSCETLYKEADFVTMSLDRSALLNHTVRAIVIDKSSDGDAKAIGFSPELWLEPSTTQIYTAHSSPFLEALQTQGHAFELTYGKLKDGTTRTTIAADLAFDRPPTAPQDFTPPGSLADFSNVGFVITQTHDTTTLFELKTSLADVQRISSPYETPQNFYAQSNGLWLLALGDVDASVPSWLLSDGSWNPEYDGRGLHLLSLRFTFEQAAQEQ